MDNKNKKSLFLTDIEAGLEPILQQVTNIQPENMLMIQSYGSSISHPYGEVMRSIILSIYQENVEEIFVVGIEDNRKATDEIQKQLTLSIENMDDKKKTVDYLLKYCNPEFFGASVSDWLVASENVEESINKSVEIIQNHPLVPSYVNIHGLVVNKNGELATVN